MSEKKPKKGISTMAFDEGNVFWISLNWEKVWEFLTKEIDF